MKLPRILKLKSSIATRLTWHIILSITAVFIVILIFIILIFCIAGFILLLLLNITAIQVSNEKINNVFATVETAISNNVPEVWENLNNDKHLFFVQENILALNPNIVGAAVAFNPDYEPKKGQSFAPYAYRDSTGIHSKQLNEPSYDYQHQEWYQKPIELGKGTWSEPYIDKGGGEIPMITYSLPLTNNHGEIYAIQTADISLGWLSDLTQEMDSTFNDQLNWSYDDDLSEQAYSFIVSREGTFVVHPNQAYVHNKTILDFFKENAVKNTNISDSKNGNSEVFKGKNNRLYMMFYSPIEHTGWTMGVIIPIKNILDPVFYFIVALIVIMIIGLIIIALICQSVIRHITKPLRLFADSADEIAKGNFRAGLPKIKSKDEMLRLRNSFETMQTSLIRQIKESKIVNEEKGRMESELQIANNIQQSMLPKHFPPYPDRDDIDIYGRLRPAKEVGGDLFDFFLRDEKLFFCIGDVSGKGVPASLVMAVTRSLFRSISAHENRPAKIVNAINESITKENDSNMFVTFFMGVLDLPTGRLRFCNSGHNAPIIAKQDDTKFLDIISNIPLGVLPDFHFEEQECTISYGTTIFLYTDGVNEAENKEHKQLGDNRILSIAQNMYDISSYQQIKIMTDSVVKHADGAEQSDDLTMLSIKYLHQQDKDAKSKCLTLKNEIEELNKLPEFVEAVCEDAGVDTGLIVSLNLALEEAVTNVVLYAYQNGEGFVDIDAVYNKKCLKFVITDTGIAFDPTKKEAVDITLGVEERSIGGLGIHLVRQIMDSVNYERVDGKNVLTLRKILTHGTTRKVQE